MTDQSTSRRVPLTRRAFVGKSAAASLAVAGLAMSAETATAQRQSDAPVRAVIPRAEDFATDGYSGLLLHFGGESPGELDTSVIRECDFASWSPEDTTYHNGTLIDPSEEATPQVPRTIFTNERGDIETGSLWRITGQQSCPGEYVGLNLERIGASQLEVTATPTPEGTPAVIDTEDLTDTPVPTETETDAPTETGTETGAGGPGFGVLAALAGIGGFAGVRRWLTSE